MRWKRVRKLGGNSSAGHAPIEGLFSPSVLLEDELEFEDMIWQQIEWSLGKSVALVMRKQVGKIKGMRRLRRRANE